jgi:hypothetical protein
MLSYFWHICRLDIVAGAWPAVYPLGYKDGAVKLPLLGTPWHFAEDF